MRVKLVLPAALGVVGVTALTAVAFGWPFEKAAYLAPVIVACLGAIAFLVVIWSRVVWESWLRQEHKGRIVAITLGAIAVIAALTALGLKLPRE